MSLNSVAQDNRERCDAWTSEDIPEYNLKITHTHNMLLSIFIAYHFMAHLSIEIFSNYLLIAYR